MRANALLAACVVMGVVGSAPVHTELSGAWTVLREERVGVKRVVANDVATYTFEIEALPEGRISVVGTPDGSTDANGAADDAAAPHTDRREIHIEFAEGGMAGWFALEDPASDDWGGGAADDEVDEHFAGDTVDGDVDVDDIDADVDASAACDAESDSDACTAGSSDDDADGEVAPQSHARAHAAFKFALTPAGVAGMHHASGVFRSRAADDDDDDGVYTLTVDTGRLLLRLQQGGKTTSIMVRKVTKPTPSLLHAYSPFLTASAMFLFFQWYQGRY